MPPSILRVKRKRGEEPPEVIYVEHGVSPAKRRNDGGRAADDSEPAYRRIPLDLSGAEFQRSLEDQFGVRSDGQLAVQNIAALDVSSAAESQPRAAPATARRSAFIKEDAKKQSAKGDRSNPAAKLSSHRRFCVLQRESTSIESLIAAQTSRAKRQRDHAQRKSQRARQATPSTDGNPDVISPSEDVSMSASPNDEVPSQRPTPNGKRPSRTAREGLQRLQGGATPPRNGLQSPTQGPEGEHALLALAKDLGAFSVVEAAARTEVEPPWIAPLPTLVFRPASRSGLKYSPKPAPPRYNARHATPPGNDNEHDTLQGAANLETDDTPAEKALTSDVEVEMTDSGLDGASGDEDWVYDIFVREPQALDKAQGELRRATDHELVDGNWGFLVLTEEDEELWREDEEADAETRSLSDYEDENAEDFYTNDYPEEEEHDSENESSDPGELWRPNHFIYSRDSGDEDEDDEEGSGLKKVLRSKRLMGDFGHEYLNSGDEDEDRWSTQDLEGD